MKLLQFEVIPSTNLYLKENYDKLDNLTCVTCNHQTNGRGRLGRSWFDKDDDLLFSILIKKEKALSNPTDYSFLVAATLYKVLKDMGLNPLIKWPNDIMLSNKKVCGILLESVSITKLECIIIGVGINVGKNKFEGELENKATSLENELNKKVDKTDLLNKILYRFNLDYVTYNNTNIRNYLTIIRKNSYLKNKEIKFNHLGIEYYGTVQDISDDGFLIVKENKTSEIMYLNSGEVTLENIYK